MPVRGRVNTEATARVYRPAATKAGALVNEGEVVGDELEEEVGVESERDEEDGLPVVVWQALDGR